MIQKFIEFARSKAPAKDQKRFKKDLETWYLSLPVDAKQTLNAKLSKSLRWREKFWTPLAYDMLAVFEKKELPHG